MDPISIAAVGTWAWDTFGKDIAKNAADQVKERWNKFNTEKRWKAAAEKYAESMYALHSTTRMLGKNEPVPLDDIYCDVNVLPKPLAMQRFDFSDPDHLNERYEKFTQELTRKPGLEVVDSDRGHRLFILGKPGAGKTTFLRYVAMRCLRQQKYLTPIFVSLNEWSLTGGNLLDFIAKQFAICNFPDAKGFIKKLLQSGKALMMFDGLDEVRVESNRRAQVINTVSNFVNTYRDVQCLVTCRVATVSNFAFGAGDPFTYVELADFTEAQAREFINRWFKDDPGARQKLAHALFEAKDEKLKEFSNVPLLLSLLCINFIATRAIPHQRHEIYAEAVEYLLRGWDAADFRKVSRDPIFRELSRNRMRQLLASIAYETFLRGDYYIKHERLCEMIERQVKCLTDAAVEGSAVLQKIEEQNGLLVERANRLHSFSHATLQEYFTALYISNSRYFTKSLSDLLTTGRMGNVRWQVVIRMACGMLAQDAADDFATNFAASIEQEISVDADLMKLVSWANKKAHQTKYGKGVIALYCYFAIALALVLDRTRDHARDLGFDIAIALARAFGVARDLFFEFIMDIVNALDITHPLDRELNFDLVVALDRELHRTLTRALTHTLDTALDPVVKLDWLALLVSNWTYIFSFRQKIETAMYRDYVELRSLLNAQASAQPAIARALAPALADLPAPRPRAAQEEWEKHDAQLRKVLQMQLDIAHEGDFTEAQLNKLSRYFEATRLLNECLPLMSLSPEVRAQVQARLLNPFA